MSLNRQPHTPFPPAIACPWCEAPVAAYLEGAASPTARYMCGTTSLMLYNELHVDEDTPRGRSRVLEHWKRRLKREGVEDAALSLDIWRPEEAHARLETVIAAWERNDPPIQAKLRVRA